MTVRTGRLAALVVAVALALAVTGCSAITNLIDTQRALQAEGFSSVSVRAANNDVEVSVSEPTVASESDDVRVAQVVWGQLHESFDYLDVTVHGSAGPISQTYSFQQLQEHFGARPAAWNQTSVQSATLNTGIVVLAVIGGVIVVTAIVVVIIVVRVRRRRRNQAARYGAYPTYPGVGPWPPGAYPYPGQWGPAPTGTTMGPQQYPPSAAPPPPPQYPSQPTTPPPADPPRPTESGPAG